MSFMDSDAEKKGLSTITKIALAIGCYIVAGIVLIPVYALLSGSLLQLLMFLGLPIRLAITVPMYLFVKDKLEDRPSAETIPTSAEK